MDITEKNILRDRLKTKIIKNNRDKLINEKKLPNEYSLPVSIQFELTSKCNLHCIHCYNCSNINNNDRVTPKDWMILCKKIVKNGGIFQATISGGEPLLLGKNLWNIMDILHKDNTTFNLISNGLLFNNEVLNKCKDYNFFWIQISIDNIYPKSHDKFRGAKGSWKKAASAAYHIALSGIPLRVASTITPRDIDKLEKFVQMAINLGASYYIIGEVMPSGRSFDNKNIFLNKNDRNNFYIEMEKLIKKYSKIITIYMSGSQRIQLEYASSSVIEGAILRPDGNIRLDCGCPFVIGNFLENDFITIWKNKTNCWNNEYVKKYIDSCDPISGFSTFIKNYKQQDIVI